MFRQSLSMYILGIINGLQMGIILFLVLRPSWSHGLSTVLIVVTLCFLTPLGYFILSRARKM